MVPRILNSIFGLIQRKNNDEYNKLVGVWTPSTKLEVFFCAECRVFLLKNSDIIIFGKKGKRRIAMYDYLVVGAGL